MTIACAARRAVSILCAAALAAIAGCTEAPPSPAEPGSKTAGVPPPQDLPPGVKLGKGTAEVR